MCHWRAVYRVLKTDKGEKGGLEYFTKQGSSRASAKMSAKGVSRKDRKSQLCENVCYYWCPTAVKFRKARTRQR